jgi:hypothetical protein
VRALLFSLPLHAAGLFVVELLQHNNVINTTLRFEGILRLLTGNYSDHFSTLAQTLYANRWYVVLYYVPVFALAAAVGYGLRHVVWKKKWDVHYPWLFRYKNDWLYKLLGRDVPVPAEYPNSRVFVRIEALTKLPAEVPGKTILYQGIVEAFTTDENGVLRDIWITDVKRGRFYTESKRQPSHPRGTRHSPAKRAKLYKEDEDDELKFTWKRVEPGRWMVLKYSELLNLNVTYVVNVPQALAGTSSPPAE